jgi:hypothetical protein
MILEQMARSDRKLGSSHHPQQSHPPPTQNDFRLSIVAAHPQMVGCSMRILRQTSSSTTKPPIGGAKNLLLSKPSESQTNRSILDMSPHPGKTRLTPPQLQQLVDFVLWGKRCPIAFIRIRYPPQKERLRSDKPSRGYSEDRKLRGQWL